MDSRPFAAMEMYRIHGTGETFYSRPDDLDERAAQMLLEIKLWDCGTEVFGDILGMDPHSLPNTQSFAFGYQCFKRTFVYHEGNHKTNWIMVVYSLIYENVYMEAADVVLCHVFQSDNYNPLPKPFPRDVPNISDFHKEEVDSCMLHLEGLMKNPESFKDFYELNEMYIKRQVNGRNGKRADVWENYTPIEVRGPDGKVMLTLAICHGCNMAYLTGKWDPKKRKVTNNGTNTLKEHYRKCSDHHHIAVNPQGADHQIS